MFLFKLPKDAPTIPILGTAAALGAINHNEQTIPAIKSGHAFWLLGIHHYGHSGIF